LYTSFYLESSFWVPMEACGINFFTCAPYFR